MLRHVFLFIVKIFPSISTLSLIIISMCFSSFACAQDQHALLIGIGEYIKVGETNDTRFVCRKGGIKDLQCAVNDLEIVNQLLLDHYVFPKENISVIKNKAATRRNILDALDKALLECKPGDIFMFYYSGHGSFKPNPLSLERDLMNETIVPSDGIYSGADIQDKELAMRFQQFVDKGIVLTIIMDSCHSGSIARGIDTEYKSADVPELEQKAVDSANEEFNDPFLNVNPAQFGALVLSAAQDFQQAQGKKFPDGKFYSTFTHTFIDVIKKSQEDFSADELFEITMSRMRYAGIAQIPVLEGTEKRRSSALFGNPIAVQARRFPVLKINADKSIVIEGGVASGLEIGSVLQEKKSGVKIQVKSQSGLNGSVCSVISGASGSVKAGSLFEVIKHGSSGKRENLKLYLPRFEGSAQDFFSRAQESNIPDGQALMWNELYLALKGTLDEEYAAIECTNQENADYVVIGKYDMGLLSFGLQRNALIQDATDPYPIQSDYYFYSTGEEEKLAESLASAAYKLHRTKAWLTMETSLNIPYGLKVRRNNERDLIRSGDVYGGDQVHIYLEHQNALDTTRHFIYVFGISSDGSIQLIFPLNGSNVENFLPMKQSDNLIEICAPTISAPFGVDHLVMLATKEPIINPRMIEQEGVSTRSVGLNGIEELVSSVNSQSRGVISQKQSGDYFIDRLSLMSHEKR
jgi:DNA-binding Xre family transcriptional regulator